MSLYIRQVPLLACLWVFLTPAASPQGFTDSNLPIIIINTDRSAEIVDDPRVRANMKIIYRGPGQRNYVSDQNNSAYLNYNGRIDIELRGSSSQYTFKKQYGFSTKQADNTTNNNVSLLGMPNENDWILNSMTFDPALIRDYLSYNLSRQIGAYATRTAYCEVVIGGVHKGLYLLQEKIKADNNRVDVMQITPIDNLTPAVSGGYITKADKNTGNDPTTWTMYSWHNVPVNYIHDLPKPESATGSQTIYIRSQFQLLEASATNANLANGFPSIIDVPSFVDHILVNELASNADAYQFSTFFHKDRSGKLRAGPIWDHDLTYGNDLFFWGFDRSKNNIWQFSNNDNEGSRFWIDLFNNSTFRCYLAKKWNTITQPGQPFNRSYLEGFIDQTVSEISEAVVRDYELWGTVGDYTQHIGNIKFWLAGRITWMTENLGSFAACENVAVPPLVITRIMYHPDTIAIFPSEDLEFIEITNNSDQTVSLTGVYFSGTGLAYQFPSTAILGPHGSCVIASNSSAFRSHYGCDASGQFFRHLSNMGQSLVLADGFGNIIDFVHYQDTVPWPYADGNGSHLKLTDPNLDNNLAVNWTASTDTVVSDRNIAAGLNVQLYPNPVRDMLHIQAGAEIESLQLTDMQGRLLLSVPVNNASHELDMSRYQVGTYIIRIITPDDSYTVKIVRE
jgi:spore coat protein CotH